MGGRFLMRVSVEKMIVVSVWAHNARGMSMYVFKFHSGSNFLAFESMLSEASVR